MMYCEVSNLVYGQTFRFPNTQKEYVVSYVDNGTIRCVKLCDYYKPGAYRRHSIYFTLSDSDIVEVPPYYPMQLTLFNN